MKHFSILSISFVLISLIGKTQTQGDYIYLNSPLPTGQYTYEASEEIGLQTGFKATAEQSTDFFLGKINPLLVVPPVIGEFGGPSTNDNGVVGSMGGAFNVSENGAATFNLPIEVAPGINGMQPQLSLSYNSQAGNGLMGFGWNLTGLSSISRMGSTLYHDNVTKGVEFNDSDHFALDGNRLFCTSGTYGQNNSEYRTEIEIFSKIVAYRTSYNGPEYFKVWTKSGQIIEYGNSANSKIELPGTSDVVNVWLINKISDRHGNYIEFAYDESDYFGYYKINSIKYTGNEIENILPACEIKFKYRDDREDKLVTFIAPGKKNELRHLLTDVEMYVSGTKLYSYKIDYQLGISTKVTSIKRIQNSNIELNPVEFEYSPPADLQTMRQIPITEIEYYYVYNGEGFVYDGDKSLMADFNGDGKLDFLIVYRFWDENKWSGYRLYLNGADGHYYLASYGNLKNDEFLKFLPCNLNGDQKTDVFCLNHDGGLEIQPWICNGTSFEPKQTIRLNGTIPSGLDFLPFNFTGDPRSELLITYNYNTNLYMHLYSFDLNIDASVIETSITCTDNWEYYFGKSMDFDGYSEFVRLTMDGMYIYDLSSTSPMISDVRPFNFPNANYQVYWGDYNADGLDDLLYRDKATGIWETKLFNGNGYTHIECPVTLNVNPDTERVTYSILDYNGDGLGDIYQCYLEIENPKTFKNTFYYFNGNSFVDTNNFYVTGVNHDIRKNPIEKTTDLNGDGINDLIFQANNGDNAGFVTLVEYEIFKENKSNQICKVIDELDNKIEINYKHLPYCNGDINNDPEYVKQDNAVYPFIDFQGPISVVTYIITYDGLGFSKNNQKKIKYTYEGAKVNTYGKGYLGFMKTTVFDSTYHTKTVTINKIVNTADCIFKHPDITYSKVEKEGVLKTLNETVYEYQIFNNNGLWGKRFAPYLIKTHNKIKDENGNYLKTNRTDVVYDSIGLLYGNPKITINYSDESEYNKDAATSLYKYYTRKTFQYNYTWIDKWLLGLPQRVDVIDYLQNEPQITNFQEFVYYPPTAPLYPANIQFVKTNTGQNLGSVAEYAYNNLGLKISSTLSCPDFIPEIPIPLVQSRTETYNFNPDYGYRFLTKTTNALNHTAESIIDPIKGTVIESKDPNGFVNKYYYDSFGRQYKSIAYDGIQTASVIRWAEGHQDKNSEAIYYKWTSRSGKSPEIVFYDRMGREVRIVTYNQAGQKVYIDKVYNHKGYLITESEPHVPVETQYLVTSSEYDELGRVKKITAPGNNITNFGYGVRSESITNHLGLTSSKSYNALGWLKTSTDTDNKTVNFAHYSDGKAKTSQVGDIAGSIIQFEYDINGNTTKITDPSWGIITNYYNPYNEQYYTKDGNDNKYSYIHDKLGRIIEKINMIDPNDHVSWDYDDTGKLGMLISESNNAGHHIEYQYGQFNRISEVAETIDGNQFITKYDYDPLGRETSLSYPDGLNIKYLYDSYTGELKQVKRSSDDANIWSAVAYNPKAQIITSRIGNYTMSKTYFPETNLLKSTTSNGIQSFEYAYDQLGNMTDRYDHLHKISNVSLHEHFTYDYRNQLKTITKNGILQCEMFYDNLGNISNKTDVGDLYCITPGNPYQLNEIIPDNLFRPDYKALQNITYTDFNKVDSITSDQYTLKINYGLGNDRITQKQYARNGSGATLLSTKTYIGGLTEIIELRDSSSTTINYINSPEGLVAIEITKSTGSKDWYWAFTDHLGSITSLVRESDGQKFEMSFDAWGNRRDPATWVNYSTAQPDFIIDRGFTGHEHLDIFNLINMNGRVYDPVIARFLSPDGFIQAPGLAQNYNGYIYCLNNPLIYTDPSGEIIFTIIGAIFAPVTGGASLALGIAMDVGGAINLGIKASQGKINSFGDGLAAYGIGAAAGAVGYATGGAAFAAAGGAAGGAGGFLAGFAGSAVGSAYTMPIQSIGNTMYFGDPMMTPDQYALGILGGGVLGGSIQGISALANGKIFWNGTVKPSNIGTPTPAPLLQFYQPEVKLNTDGMRSQIKPMPDKGIFYLDNAKNAIKYSDGVPIQVVRDPNFRNNLISSSGVNPGSAAQAHHIFPLEHAINFHNAGINPNSYGAWWGAGHLNNAYNYNQAWGSFFRANPGASQSQIFSEAIRLKILFGY